MNEPTFTDDTGGIPQQIIEQYLERLSTDGLPADLISKLRETLLVKGDISETAIRTALSFADEKP